jgi:hypothetical protein
MRAGVVAVLITGTAMKFAPAALIVSGLTLLPVADLLAGDADQRALYSATYLLTLFSKYEMAELKITADQERSLKANQSKKDKLWKAYMDELTKLNKSKLSEKDKNAKHRALETQVSNDLLDLYGESLRPEQVKRIKQITLQVKGMEIFDYPEIRSALKITDKQVKTLQSAFDKLAQETLADLRADVKAKRITEQEAARKASAMSSSVPERVRESLNNDQKKTLEDLLGPKYTYGR